MYVLRSQFQPDQMLSSGLLFAITDFTAHMLALLSANYCYRFLHQRAREIYSFLVGWILIVAIYYTLLVLLQSLLIRIVFPDLPPVSALFQDFLLELLVALIITTLILLALPEKYRKPQWYESEHSQDKNSEIPGKEKEGAL